LWKQFKTRFDNAQKQAESGVLPNRATSAAYLIEVWLPKVRREVEPNTYESYHTTVTTYIVPVIGPIRLSDV